MARDLEEDFAAAVTEGTVRPALFCEFEFDSATLRFWNGIGSIAWNGEVWTGAGNLLRVDIAEETQDLEASNAAFELSGVPTSLISLALDHATEGRGRPCRIWLGALTLEAVAGAFSSAFSSAFAVYRPENSVVADPVRLFSGKMGAMLIDGDPKAPVIRLSAENDLIILNRARNRRYTHEDQQLEYSGDLGFEFVAQMQDKEFTWGTT